MNEDQAQTMIDLLTEISAKLTDISDKIASDTEYQTISDKLDKLDKLDDIESKLRDIDRHMPE